MAQMPTGFAKSEVWLELINEPDESKCQWLGEFGVQCAANALRDGYNISMFRCVWWWRCVVVAGCVCVCDCLCDCR